MWGEGQLNNQGLIVSSGCAAVFIAVATCQLPAELWQGREACGNKAPKTRSVSVSYSLYLFQRALRQASC